MKYLALVAFLLAAVLPAPPVAAAEGDADPVQVRFPDVTAINPAHTPYVVEVHDPQPELGDLVLTTAARSLALPHEGSLTVELSLDDAADGDVAVLDVLRCTAPDACTETGRRAYVRLVDRLRLDPLDDGLPVGLNAHVPAFPELVWPVLDEGDVLHLSWTLTALKGGGTVTSGEADHVVGDELPLLGIPADTTVTAARLTVRAVSDSARWGRLEGTSTDDVRLDVTGPPIPVRVVGDTLFPAKDGYLDRIELHFTSTPYDLVDLRIDIVDPQGTVRPVHRGAEGPRAVVYFDGRYHREPLPPGRYTLRMTGYDEAQNTTVRETPVRIDDRRRVQRTFRRTIPAARTVADKYVGACSRLGPAAGRGWPGSLGLYSKTPCPTKNGAVVMTINGVQVPPSVGGYPGEVELSLYGGAARGVGSAAYLVHGWFRAGVDKLFQRRQFAGRLGAHRAYGVPADDVVRASGARRWLYWQVGLAGGSRYDVKSFTISMGYYELVEPTSRTASDAKTMADPSGAPGPG